MLRMVARDCSATGLGASRRGIENSGVLTPKRLHTAEIWGLPGVAHRSTARAMAASPTCRHSHSSVRRSLSLDSLTKCSIFAPGNTVQTYSAGNIYSIIEDASSPPVAWLCPRASRHKAQRGKILSALRRELTIGKAGFRTCMVSSKVAPRSVRVARNSFGFYV